MPLTPRAEKGSRKRSNGAASTPSKSLNYDPVLCCLLISPHGVQTRGMNPSSYVVSQVETSLKNPALPIKVAQAGMDYM